VALESLETDFQQDLNGDGVGVAQTVDTIAPSPSITSKGGIINHAAQTVAGTIDVADAGLTVWIFDGVTLLGTVSPAADGSWSKLVTLSGQGVHALTAKATDAAGNAGSSFAVDWTLDSIAPTLSITSGDHILTNAASQTVTGTIDVADAGLSVSIFDGTTLLGTVTPAASGTWSTQVTLPGEGYHWITAQATDAAGNVGTSPAVTYAFNVITIETFGLTTLDREADKYFMRDHSASGPGLAYRGAAVSPGEFGPWTPIGAEKTADGYEIAWKNGALDQYSIWLADNNGNMLSNPTGVVGGSDFALQAYETSFQQDLNGDGVIGVQTTVIETHGGLRLVHEANRLALLDSSNNGPMLSFQGAPIVDGEFGDWVTIGAEKAGSDYEIAWKEGSLDQYSIWLADNNGNMLSNPTGVVGGSDFALQAYETSFQQDLDGDGMVGVQTTVIETHGATRLMHEANRLALLDGNNNGPMLSFRGAPVVDGEFGDWTAIGAEKIANGYEIAWKNGSLDQYSIWLADNNGSMNSNPSGVVGGSDFALQSYEASFQQDLNGDGTTGVVTSVIESFGATKLVHEANRLAMLDDASNGPTLMFQGAPVTDGEFGNWTAIGAEKTSSGYEVAWKNGSLDQYSIWLADNNGNMFNNPTGVVGGSDFALQSYEPSFQQDLNGDKRIGLAVPPLG
jgi:hypothetical protein